MINYLKQYKDHLTFYLLYLYIIGFAYYIFYYENFGIKIFTYLTLSEVLLSSVSLCTNIFLFFLLTELLIAILSVGIITFFPKCKFTSASITISIIIILCTIFFGEKLFSELNYIAASLLTIQLLIKLLIISSARPENDKYKNKATVILGCILFVATVILISVSGYSDYKDVVRGESKFTNIKVITNDTIYSTIESKSLYYIGETQLALFLYEMNENNTIVINRSNIKEIVILNKAFSKKQEEEIQQKVEGRMNRWFKIEKE